MSHDDRVDQWGKVEDRVSQRWPLLTRDDLADVAIGQASLLEVLQRRYEGDRSELEAAIMAFEQE